MNLIENHSKREAMIQYLSGLATADSDADVDALLKIYNPLDDRAEMGKVFQDTLGYNPITHYDITDINSILDKVINDVESDKVAKKLGSKKDEIILRARAIYEENREKNMKAALQQAISEYIEDMEQVNSILEYDAPARPKVSDDEDDDEGYSAVASEDDEEDEEEGLKIDTDDDIDLDDPDIPELKFPGDEDDIKFDEESDEDDSYDD